MPRFDYQARNAQGESLQGAITATSQADAARLLRADGKFVINLRETAAAAEAAATEVISFGGNRVKGDDVIFFISQMAVMVDTGVSVTEALDGIIEQTESPGFKRVLKKILADVETGQQLSAALQKHRKVFKPLVINLVKASEASGRLGPMLDRCATYLVNQRDTRKKVVGAMIYPAFLLLMSINVVIFLLTFLMPRFTAIYAGKEQLLPWPTKVLIAVTTWLKVNWMWWGGGAVATIGFLVFYFYSQQGRRTRDWMLLHIPLIGRMMQKSCLTRSLRTLGTLIDAGVAMLDAVGITGAVSGNAYYQDMWNQVDQRVQHGEQLSKPLYAYKLMPRGVTQMITAGERTGHLPEVLERVSSFLERDLEQAIRRVTNMIEPIMIFVMGGLVGSIAISLLLPIFTISKVIGR